VNNKATDWSFDLIALPAEILMEMIDPRRMPADVSMVRPRRLIQRAKANTSEIRQNL
jgi:hypothetical protein